MTEKALGIGFWAKGYRSGVAVLLGTGSAIVAMPAQAQDIPTPTPSAATQSDDGALGDIVVTAQRRDERLQTVPIAVSAVTSDALQSKGIKTTVDLNLVVSSLNVSRTSGGTGLIFIRGVGTNTNNPGVEPPVAFYTDSVYSAGAVSNTSTFSNIDHIEVLKGPQGTLFGRNSMGGLVNVITKDPSAIFSGRVTAGYANYDSFEGNAYLTGPIAENLNADIAIYGYNQGTGWGKNFTTGKDVNFRKEFAVRSKWQFKPTVDTTLTLVVDYGSIKTDLGDSAQPLPNLPKPPASLSAAVFRGSIYDAIGEVQGLDRLHNYGGYFRIEHSFDAIRVTATTAYRSVTRRELLDNDQTPYALSTVIYDPDTTKTVSQELQVQSSSASRIQWIGGVYYFHADAGAQPLTIFLPATNPAKFISNNTDIVTNSYSAYAQATMPIFTEHTKLALGGRYTQDVKSIDGTVDTALGRTGSINDRRKWGAFTYRVALSQQFDPSIMGYASISSGFKSGQFNPSNPLQGSVDPEKLTDYEIGLKTELLNRHVVLNLSGFYYDYTNIQLSAVGQTGTVLSNAAAAKIYGLEIEGQARVTHNLSLTYGLSLLHSEYSNFKTAVSIVTSPTTGLGVTTPIDATGNQLQRTPTSNASAGFDYVVPTRVGTFGINGAYAYNGGFFFDVDNQYKQKPYSLANFEVRWSPNSDRYTVRAWVKNAFDEKYYSLIRTGAGIPPYGAAGAPRTYGGSIEVKF